MCCIDIITIAERLELPAGKIYLLALAGRNLNYLNYLLKQKYAISDGYKNI